MRQAAWAHHRAGHGESAGADPGHRGDPRPGGRQRGPWTWPRIQVGPQSCQLGVAGPGGREPCGGHGSGYFPWPESDFWAHQAPGQGEPKRRCPGACPSGFFGGPVPCCRRRHPVVRRTRQRCRAAKATQGGPLQAAHTWAVPRGAAKIWNRGGLEEVGLRPLPMVPVFYRCTVAASGVGGSTRRPPLRRVPWVCPPA